MVKIISFVITYFLLSCVTNRTTTLSTRQIRNVATQSPCVYRATRNGKPIEWTPGRFDWHPDNMVAHVGRYYGMAISEGITSGNCFQHRCAEYKFLLFGIAVGYALAYFEMAVTP